MEDLARIEIEIILGGLEKSRGYEFESFGSCEQIGANFVLRLNNLNDLKELSVLLIYSMNEEATRLLIKELNKSQTDILLIAFPNLNKPYLPNKILTEIVGCYSYKMRNLSSDFWNDQRIRNANKSGIFLFEKLENHQEVDFVFTTLIHPEVFEQELYKNDHTNLISIGGYTTNQKGSLSTRIFVKYHSTLYPIWSKLPFGLRRLIKKVSSHV